jgi:release factor glutamine methyltransferase
MTLRELVERAENELRNSPHPERARLDAETLLLHTLHQNRAWLMAHADEDADESTESEYASLIGRRQAGEPIQYITGSSEFFGLPFSIGPGVLIPRPETEHLVEEVLRLAEQSGLIKPHIADIGTGSGIIAVALAHSIPGARITAIDLSTQALLVARENAERNHVTDRIEFLEGDLLTPLGEKRFHIIASNPPYIPASDHDSLSIEVRKHEPHSALFAGDDGLDIYRRLIPAAREHLLPGGWLVMEIGYGQQDAIGKLLSVNAYNHVRFIADYQEIPRVAIAQKERD